MIYLDESKIRTGKSLGLPYIGSKKKIAKKIIAIIKQNFNSNLPIYDIFGGGGAITAECLLNGLTVTYNDLNKNITDSFQKVLKMDYEWLKTLIVSREEFMRIREKTEKTTDDYLKLLINSFGYDCDSYIYSKDTEKIKNYIVSEILAKENYFNGYQKSKTYQVELGKLSKDIPLDKLDQFKRLEQLPRLYQLERLQNAFSTEVKNNQQLCLFELVKPYNKLLTVTNHDYKKFSNIKNSTIYLDPPYEFSDVERCYNLYFDHLDFYDWAYRMSKNNIVLMSSYSVSDNRFVEVFEFKKARSTLQGGITGKVEKTEKLFMVK